MNKRTQRVYQLLLDFDFTRERAAVSVIPRGVKIIVFRLLVELQEKESCYDQREKKRKKPVCVSDCCRQEGKQESTRVWFCFTDRLKKRGNRKRNRLRVFLGFLGRSTRGKRGVGLGLICVWVN